ncbi:unnamed protein product, partial [Sphagnum balticum]
PSPPASVPPSSKVYPCSASTKIRSPAWSCVRKPGLSIRRRSQKDQCSLPKPLPPPAGPPRLNPPLPPGAPRPLPAPPTKPPRPRPPGAPPRPPEPLGPADR